MSNKKQLVASLLAAAGLISAPAAMAETPWLVRARAVYLDFDNSQRDGLRDNLGKVEAENRWIPEIDVSYFFTKNIAAELVLTYPQNVDLKLDGTKIGHVKALPPSLLVQYHFTDLGAFQPYVGVGVNYTIFSKRHDLADGLASVGSSSVGPVAQVGFDYALDKNWSLNLDVKYVKMDTDVKLLDNKVGRLDLNPFTYGVGVGYRF